MKQFLKYIVFLAGLEFIALGVAFSIKADLGTSPISSLPYAASALWPSVSVGTATIVMHVGFILIQIAILRREFRWFQLTQLPIGVAFGLMIDFSMWLIGGIEATTSVAKWAYCLMGVVLVGFGVWLEVLPRVLYLAGEGVMIALMKVLPFKMGYVKIVVDVSLVTSATLLSWFGLHRIVGVREGTLVAALCVGLVVRCLNKFVLHR